MSDISVQDIVDGCVYPGWLDSMSDIIVEIFL